jgi:hypothetical protein
MNAWETPEMKSTRRVLGVGPALSIAAPKFKEGEEMNIAIASIGGVLLKCGGAPHAVSIHNGRRTRPLVKFLWLLLLLPELMAQPGQAAPIIANWADSNPSLIYGANSVSQTIGGITITAQGYTAQFDGASSTILGPFPTSVGFANLQVFGTATSGLPGQLGLGLLSQPLPGIQAAGRDFGGGNYVPGIDDHGYITSIPFVAGSQPPKDEFVLFSFSSPVDVHAVVVDPVSNFSRSIWAAGGSAAPDLTADLVGAFSGYAVVNSLDDNGDGLFTHVVNFTAVSYLAVGAPIPTSVGSLGPFQPIRDSEFYVVGLDVNPANAVVPEPASALLVLTGFVGLGLAARFRRVFIAAWKQENATPPMALVRGRRGGGAPHDLADPAP